MTRIEFLGELSRKLARLPKEELDDVLSYYDEIFLDAGLENEAETAEKLGSIDDIARQILIDNNISPDGEPEYFVGRSTGGNSAGGSGSANGYDSGYRSNGYGQSGEAGTSTALKLLVLVLTFPIWLPALITVVSVAFSLIVAAFAVVFGVCIAGVLCVVRGFVGLFYEPLSALITIGIGLVLCGIMGLFGVPLVKWLCRGLKSLCSGIGRVCHNFIYNGRSA